MESGADHQGRILLVDDEAAILRTFRYCLGFVRKVLPHTT